MIAEAAAALAAAIKDAVPAAVAVYPCVPETTAAPAVWVEFTAARYDQLTGWELTYDVTVVADAATNPVDVALGLAGLLDVVLKLTVPGVTASRITARGAQTVRFGDVAYPAAVVTVPMVDTIC